MEIVIGVIVLLAAAALAAFIFSRSGSAAYLRAYDKAQLRDLEYARAHPDCSYEDAHRERDRIMKRFHRY